MNTIHSNTSATRTVASLQKAVAKALLARKQKSDSLVTSKTDIETAILARPIHHHDDVPVQPEPAGEPGKSATPHRQSTGALGPTKKAPILTATVPREPPKHASDTPPLATEPGVETETPVKPSPPTKSLDAYELLLRASPEPGTSATPSASTPLKTPKPYGPQRSKTKETNPTELDTKSTGDTSADGGTPPLQSPSKSEPRRSLRSWFTPEKDTYANPPTQPEPPPQDE